MTDELLLKIPRTDENMNMTTIMRVEKAIDDICLVFGIEQFGVTVNNNSITKYSTNIGGHILLLLFDNTNASGESDK